MTSGGAIRADRGDRLVLTGATNITSAEPTNITSAEPTNITSAEPTNITSAEPTNSTPTGVAASC
jgi:hypothetical protein